MSAAGEGAGSAGPSVDAFHERRHMQTLADGIIHLLDDLARGDGAQAGEELRLQAVADEFIERVGSAALDAVGNGGDAFVVVGVPDERDFRSEAVFEVVLEGGDLVEHGGVEGFLVARVFEGVLDERLAHLLHERVRSAGGIVDVGEDWLMVHHAEEVLLREAGGEEGAVGAHEERLLCHLADDVLHGGLHGFLHMAEIDGLAQPDQERGAHELENLDRLLGLPGRH